MINEEALLLAKFLRNERKEWGEDLERITGQKMIKMHVIVNGGLKLELIFENGKVLPKIPLHMVNRYV